MTICTGWHELLVRLADPEDGLSSNDIDYELAYGDDASVTPAYGDTALNNEVGRSNVTDFINEGTQLYTSTFLDSTEGNGETIREMGVVAVIPDEDREYLCNHATDFASFDKTSDKTATLENTLENNDDTNDS